MQEAALGMIGDGDAAAVAEQNRQMKGEIATHPMYEQLLAAHVACLRVATPIDQLPIIEAQLSQSHHLLRSYASTAVGYSHHDRELDNFLAQYIMMLCSFKEQLQQHVRVHAVEAVMACREIENNLHSLTDYWRQVYMRSPAMYNYSRSPGFYAESEVSIKSMKKEVKEVSMKKEVKEVTSVVDLIRVGRNCQL